ncbi:alpha/beta fold hydrolase [Geminicoccaceae bacterium 1502E]|nr:alpha/beta fold hydrolase [Geminicoccaceae bacterium 1502E]
MATELAARKVGQGRLPVLVLHGLLGQGRNWGAIARALEGEASLWLVDLRNHGASPWRAEMTYEAMAADLAALIEREGLGQAALIGHSMGGKVAMTLALSRPELVDRLCVVDVAPVPYDHGAEFKGYIRAMQAVDLGRLRRRAEVEEALAEAAPDRGVRAFLASNLENGDPLRWQPNLAGLLEAMPGILDFPDPAGRRFEGPTLFLRGARSRYVLPEHEARIRALFPKVSISTIEEAGHWVHAEQPARTVEILKGFLQA